MKTEERIENFEAWMDIMDERILTTKKQLPSDIADNLDYSIGSLVILEEWLLQNFKSIPEILQEKNKYLLDGLARYVGETIRIIHGGEWKLCIDEKNVYFGRPIMIDPSTGYEMDCPISMVTTAIDRQEGDILSDLVEYMKD